MNRDEVIKYFLLAPAVIVLLITTVYPILRSLWISFHSWNLTESLTLGPFIGVHNYIRAFNSPSFWNSVLVTFIFTALSVLSIIAISLGISLVLRKERKVYSYVRGFLILPFAISPALLGFSWRFMLNPDYGLFDKIIGTIFPHFSEVIWLGQPTTAMAALVSIVAWIWVPFVALAFISALINFPQELYEAARVDGASALQVFYHVTLPLLKPIILIQTTLVTMFMLRQFSSVITLTGGGPGDSTSILNYQVYLRAFRFFEMGYGAALAYILAAIMFLFTLVYMRFLVKGSGWD